MNPRLRQGNGHEAIGPWKHRTCARHRIELERRGPVAERAKELCNDGARLAVPHREQEGRDLARTQCGPVVDLRGRERTRARLTGYESAARGTNGWVCFVERSWAAGFNDREFWNPRLRSPNCFNPIAVRTELPRLLKRTEWVLGGVSKAQMMERSKAAIADGTFKAPEPGAITYMMSKSGYLSDAVAGPWLPHLMFFVPRGQAGNWGAGKDGSPMIGAWAPNSTRRSLCSRAQVVRRLARAPTAVMHKM